MRYNIPQQLRSRRPIPEDHDWIWWYIIRPFNGMALAVIFYFVIRGGLPFLGSGNGEVDIYGAVAIAGIVGNVLATSN